MIGDTWRRHECRRGRHECPRHWVVILFCLALPASLVAHDIPNDVTVQAFIKPSGDHLHLLLRVPMAAMRDIDFPTTGPGYLKVAASGSKGSTRSRSR